MAGNRKDSKGRKLNLGESQRPDGIYVYRWTSEGKRHQIYAGSLKELREKEKGTQKDVWDGIAGGNVSLNALFTENMKFKKLKASTKANYLNIWKNYVQDSFLGSMKVKDIKQIHIKKLYKELADDRKLKKNTIKHVHNLIYSSFEMAVDNDMVRKNPARKCMKNIEGDAIEKTPLSAKQVESLIDFCSNHACYKVHVPFLIIAIGTGMRVGELTGLRWSDVDLQNRKISVNHQLIYKNVDGTGCKFYISTPKTDAGKRIIPMTDAVHDAFIELKKNNMMLGKSSQVIIDGYSGFCFLSANGSPLATNAVNSFLYGIQKAYNKMHPENPLPHISAHILRHSCCTIYSDAGMGIKALQGLLGHANAMITENTYDHVSFERTQKELNQLNNVVNF